MDYPLIKEAEVHRPKDGTCMACGKKTGGRFVVLNGGALLGIAGTGVAIPDENLQSFLSIADHGVTQSGKPLNVVDNSGYGQFEFYFCSTECLRGFFNRLVDDFEQSA